MIELLVVIAIGTLLVAVTMPIGFNFYRSMLAQDVTEELSTVLRRASDEARLGKNDIAHGVYFTATSSTHFQGATYLTRVVGADEVTAIPSGVVLTGLPSEVVFAKQTGLPSTSGVLVITLYTYVHAINVDARGVVSEIIPYAP